MLGGLVNGSYAEGIYWRSYSLESSAMTDKEIIDRKQEIAVTKAMIGEGVDAYRASGLCEAECDGLDHSLIEEIRLAVLHGSTPH